MIVLNAQQLQRLAESLLRIERLLESEGGDPGIIREGLEEAAHRMGVHLAVVRLADARTLLQLHAPPGGGDPGKLWAVAELLFLDGLRALDEGDEGEGHRVLATSLELFPHVDPGLQLPAVARPPGERMEAARRILDGEAA
jgi:hypothetical protein